MENILKTLFNFDFSANMAIVRKALSSELNGLAPFERDVLRRSNLIDINSEIGSNFSKLVRSSPDLHEMLGGIYSDLSSKFNF